MKCLIILLICISPFCSFQSAFAEILYSNNDQERVEGLKRLQKTVELFKEKKGYYPFSNARRADLQFINVHITDQKLEGDDLYLPSGITGPQLGMEMLLKEYKRQGLEEQAQFTHDKRPLNSEDRCQKYFIYNWQGGNKQCYSISINLENDIKNTGYRIAKNCYPYVLSSCEVSKPPYRFIRKKN
ncbi:MAG: hypothetical protein IMF07_06080 [Proteobacteria bacterium]|nr:hypothetical protein [Pseudomonadota bacterium]